MTMSIRVVSAGAGYKYLLRSVVNADGDRSAPDQVTRYYAEAGTPPGFWLGSGVTQFGEGALQQGDEVTPEQLKRLIGAGRDPVTAKPLGRDYREYRSVDERIADRVAKLDPHLGDEEHAAATARITAEETRIGEKHAVAGFDLTFSVPKSVSVLWGVADARTQALIVAAHHAAVRETLDLLERQVAATRTGHHGVDQREILGVAAAAYDHWDSRSNDPQLHTHAVVSNKVRTADDGIWRTLDSKALHQAVVALSAHYDATLRDRLTGTFDLEWEQRRRGEDRSVQWEIADVPESLIGEFSSRSHDINALTADLIADYQAKHGRAPSSRTVAVLRAHATLATRPEKQIHSLHDLSVEWRGRAAEHLDADPTEWARAVTTTSSGRTYTARDVPEVAIEEAVATVVGIVSGKRATFKHWNLWAEAERQTMGWRLATAADRELVVGRIVEVAEHRTVVLTPPERAVTPAEMQRDDGTSRLRPRHHLVYTVRSTLDAEDRLVARSQDRTAPVVRERTVASATARPDRRRALAAEQATAVEQIATSGRQVDVLVGPAGAGKTTTMRALRRAWVAEHGAGSVVGLAPSATAASVLGADLGVTCENTAKWLFEYDAGRAAFARDQLVIVDEATLAGTATLDRITGLAAEAGAKVLLVGDPAQLQAVDAGGAFSLLVDARRDERDGVVPELTEVHRFRNEWEKTASLQLRSGDTDVIGTYTSHGRVRGGVTEDMIDAAYAAWQADVGAGLSTLLIAEAAEVVRELNERARADRLVSGATGPGRAVVLGDRLECSVGI